MRMNRAARRAIEKRGGNAVELKMKERLLLNMALPQQGNLRTIRTIEDLRRQLLPSEQEVTDFDLKEIEGGNLQWDATKDTGADIAIGPLGMKIVQDALKALDDQGTLTPEHLTLCDKFLEPDKGDDAEDKEASPA